MPTPSVRRNMLCRFSAAALLATALAAAAVITGCSSNTSDATKDGPHDPVAITSSPWTYNGDPGVLMRTPHYAIYSTIKNDAFRHDLAQTMEGAFTQYQRLAPGVPVGDTTERPMECYIFATRDQWQDKTIATTSGIETETYLHINRGGYTRRDVYIAYDCDRGATTSIAAHEGWHQFAFRHFKGRLPPFLEEGIATMFEDIDWDQGLPRWNLSRNRSRLQGLRSAVQGNSLIPLDELFRLHAGDVVAVSNDRVTAFYSGSWAFATFLWAADNGKYRPAMRRIISDVADGTVFDPTGVHANAQMGWNPAGVRPMIEHYLGMPLDQINAEYKKYVTKVAFDDYAAQWSN